MTIEKIPGKEIKEFILDNIEVKEKIVRPWKLDFKPISREVVIKNMAFISTKWVHPDYCKGFIVECAQCEDDIQIEQYEKVLLDFIVQHSEEHIRKGYKKKLKSKSLNDII